MRVPFIAFYVVSYLCYVIFKTVKGSFHPLDFLLCVYQTTGNEEEMFCLQEVTHFETTSLERFSEFV